MLLAGCATPRPSGPPFSPSPAPELATLYIYRLNTPPLARSPNIEINSTSIASLPTNAYTMVHLQSGTYEIKTDWGALNGHLLNKSATLTMEAGGSYYVEVANSVRFIGWYGTYSSRVSGSALAEPPAAIAACALVPARQVDVAPK